MNRTWSPDWPTQRLQLLLDRWDFRILRRERVRSGKAPGEAAPAAGRSTDGSLRRELACQLRRRVRCPQCGVVQWEPRRTLRRRDRRRSSSCWA